MPEPTITSITINQVSGGENYEYKISANVDSDNLEIVTIEENGHDAVSIYPEVWPILCAQIQEMVDNTNANYV